MLFEPTPLSLIWDVFSQAHFGGSFTFCLRKENKILINCQRLLCLKYSTSAMSDDEEDYMSDAILNKW